MRKAAFLDRDGTIIEDRGHLGTADGVALLPGASDGLRSLRRYGYLLVVVSNQSGLARHLFSADAAKSVHDRMVAQLRDHGISLDATYYCPHGPDDGCRCRKPESGLLTRAIAELSIDPTVSIAIGDRCRDLAAGRAAGARVLILLNGHVASDDDVERELAEAMRDEPGYAASEHSVELAILPGWHELCTWLEQRQP